jgi:dTDP-4-amino-4,6-dideoxygalactose transaminase
MDLSKNNYKDYKNAIKKVFKHGIFILGPEVSKFERKVAKYCKVPYSVAVSSGTHSLYLAMKAYDIGKGDEVIIPNISYIATANAVLNTGAKVVFCDVNDDFNINYKNIEELISSKTKAIIMVHYAGKIGEIQKIQKIAKKKNIILIEDSAQAFGARKNNKYAGTIGDVGCFSLNPMKPLGAFGEAGLILTKKKKIYNKLISLRNNGINKNKQSQYIGTNAKIDTLQATILLEKMKYVENSIARRIEIAKLYTSKLKNIVQTPEEPLQNDVDVYFTYTIISKKRDKLLKFLIKNGIEAKVYHTAMSCEKPYKEFHNISLKNSLCLSKYKLALPCNDTLENKDVLYIIKKIKEFFK